MKLASVLVTTSVLITSTLAAPVPSTAAGGLRKRMMVPMDWMDKHDPDENGALNKSLSMPMRINMPKSNEAGSPSKRMLVPEELYDVGPPSFESSSPDLNKRMLAPGEWMDKQSDDSADSDVDATPTVDPWTDPSFIATLQEIGTDAAPSKRDALEKRLIPFLLIGGIAETSRELNEVNEFDSEHDESPADEKAEPFNRRDLLQKRIHDPLCANFRPWDYEEMLSHPAPSAFDDPKFVDALQSIGPELQKRLYPLVSDGYIKHTGDDVNKRQMPQLTSEQVQELLKQVRIELSPVQSVALIKRHCVLFDEYPYHAGTIEAQKEDEQ